MKNRTIIVVLAACLSALTQFSAHAGETIWGPQKFVRCEGWPEEQSVSFTIDNPKGEFSLKIANGEGVQNPGAPSGMMEMKNLVSSAVITLNGARVVAPEDFSQNELGFSKNIAIQEQNTITVKLAGKPGSFITLKVYRKTADNLNPGVENVTGDVLASNMQDRIVLWWLIEDKAAEYVIYKAYSKDGPWNELGRIPLPNGVDVTPEAAARDLYYKIEALDDEDKVIKRYPPVFVPKFRTLENVQ